MQHPLILILIGSVVSSYNMGIVPCLYFVCICQVLTTVLKNFLHTLMSLTALPVLSSHKVLLLWPVTSTLIFLFFCSTPNQQGRELFALVDRNHLYPVSCSNITSGPNYTYFSGSSKSTVDYIFLDAAFSSNVQSCEIRNHHPLNLSDHLPITLTISSEFETKLFPSSPAAVNWSKAILDGSVKFYASRVHSEISPLLDISPISVGDLDREIQSVVSILIGTAQDCLPSIKRSNQKFILDHRLASLCKLSKLTWKRWKNAGRPTHGLLYREKQDASRAVKQHVSACRARRERLDIQKRDLLFKKGHNRRFRVFKPQYVCSKLLDGNQQSVTDPSHILELFRSYFSDLASSNMHTNSAVSSAAKSLSSLEADSFTNDDQILDFEVTDDEVESALSFLKLGRSKGADGLNAEHLLYGGKTVVRWLRKIFNSIISLEEIPHCFKEGIIIPVYKGKGKDPLHPMSYRGITLSSIIAKTFEVVILKRMSPILDERGFPDINQTAFQRGISCNDAIFSTQEVLLNYIRQGENPFLCFYDIEKAFDSVEFPILLTHLFTAGINGKSWRLIKSWYDSPTSRVKHGNKLSSSFLVNRGVKQGSVLSPSLFLIVMNSLLQRMRDLNCGGSIHGTFIGTAVHADDVRSIAPIQSVASQFSEINDFVTSAGLKLNPSKLELIRISQSLKDSVQVFIGDHVCVTKNSARCLGIQWQGNLSASESISTNISKARRAFFGLGSTGVFHGKLNPLSGSSIFETCIIPILLYGSETWLLDSSCIRALEKFQCEIGRRILKLSKFHANDVIRIALHWPSVATRVLLRKLSFLSKLLTNSNDILSSRIFTTLAMDEIYSISVVQQCRMLEAPLSTDIVNQCLTSPNNAVKIVHSNKKFLLKCDYDILISTAMMHPSVEPIAKIASIVSWRKIWDGALDYGVKGTYCGQAILRELGRPVFGDKLCHLCKEPITCFSSHLCNSHPTLVCHESLSSIVNKIAAADISFVVTLGSKLRSSSVK